MRKLFNFYRICYCYILIYIIFYFLFLFYIFGAFCFLLVDIEKYHTVMDKFSRDILKILEDKVKEIKQDEFDILNEGVDYCCKCKKVNWYKEIFITIFVIFLLLIWILINL